MAKVEQSAQERQSAWKHTAVKDMSKITGVQLHVFADASNTVCSAATVAVVEHSTGFVKGLLTSKSRISKCNTTVARLELVAALEW